MLTIIPVLMLSSFMILCGSCKSKSTQNRNVVSKEDVREEIEEEIDTASTYISEEKEDLLKTYESKLEDAEQELKKMKLQIASAEAAIRQDLQQKVQVMESQVAYIKLNIDQLKNSSENAWQELTTGMDTALNDLNQAIEDAKAEFN